MKSTPWKLSPQADQDLEDIFDYSEQKFGLNQTAVYVSGFDDTFNQISTNPEIGRKRDEIQMGLRSLVKESHVIFYRPMEDYIRIVRILHGSRDVSGHFPEK